MWRSVPAFSAATCRSRAACRVLRCRWPLTRRNCVPACTMPAAQRHGAVAPALDVRAVLPTDAEAALATGTHGVRQGRRAVGVASRGRGAGPHQPETLPGLG